MANNVIGTTDASNALSVRSSASKSLLIIGARNLDTGETSTTPKNTIFSIGSTGDAIAKFGSLSKVPALVRIAILNGVANIKGMIIGTVGAEGMDYTTAVLAYTAALAASLSDDTVKCIQLDVNETTVIDALSAHLDAAEVEGMLRYSAVAPDNIADDSTINTFAASLNHKRMFVPSSNFLDESGTKLSGIYAGFGIACTIMTETNDPALPLNGVEIKGFGGVDRVLLSSNKTALVNGGVIPVYNAVSGNPAIYRLVTSYTKDADGQSDPTWQEGSTVFIADDVLESVEVDLRRRFKRTKNVTRIIQAISDAVRNVLEAKQSLEIIQDLDITRISVVKDPTDLYGALVDYEIKIVTPLYTITIRQHIVL